MSNKINSLYSTSAVGAIPGALIGATPKKSEKVYQSKEIYQTPAKGAYPATVTGVTAGKVKEKKEIKPPIVSLYKKTQWTRDLGKAILRAPQRFVASAFIQPAADIMGKKAEWTPKTKFEKTVFGEEPIVGLGEKTTDTFKQVYKANLEGGMNKTAALPLSLYGSALIVGGLGSLDITPFGSGGKKAIEEIALSKSPGRIAEILKDTFKISEEKIPGLATKLVNVKKVKEVESIISKIKPATKSLQPLTKSMPGKSLLQEGSQVMSKEIPKTGEQLAKETPDISYFYNINKLKISEKAKTALTNELDYAAKELEQTPIGETLKKTVGGKLTNKEVLNVAKQTNDVLERTVTRSQTVKSIAANINLRSKLAKMAQEKEGKIDKEFLELWAKDKAAGEDIARQLQARNIGANPEDAKISNIILDAIFKKAKSFDDVMKAAEGVDLNDPKQATELYRKFVKPNITDWMQLLQYNSMLSSPLTHIVNTASNLEGSLLITPIEKTLSGALDFIRAGITGTDRKYFAGEGASYLKGYMTSVGKAYQNVKNVMTGKDFIVNPDTRNIPMYTKGAGKVAETILSGQVKMLEAMDQFFMALTRGGVEKSLAYRATKMGKPLEDVSSKAFDEATYRLFRAVKNPQEGYVLGAIDAVTNGLSAIRNSNNPVAKLLARFALPFLRTPINLFKQGLEYSPFGLSTLLGASNKTEQLSKIIIGSTAALGGAMLLGQDRLTWAEPTNADEKAAFRAAGRQPYAIKIGDNWVSYAKLHPALAFNLALISAVDDSLKQRKLSEGQADTILNTFAKYGNFMADMSYAKSIGDFLGAVKGDSEKWSSYFSGYAQQLIPFRAMMGWINNIVDPVQRKVDTDASKLDQIFQTIMKQIPGLSSRVPERLGPNGQPIPNQNRLLNAITPNKVTTTVPGAEQSYTTGLENKKTGEAFRLQTKYIKDEATKIWGSIKGQPVANQVIELKKLIDNKTNPEVIQKVLDLSKGIELTQFDETTLLGLPIKARAIQIDKQVKSFNGDKEKISAYLHNLVNKKILTVETLKEMTKSQ